MVVITDARIDLHLHPFFGRNSVPIVFDAIRKSGIDVSGWLYLDHSVWPELSEVIKQLWPSAIVDEAGAVIGDRVIFNSREYSTKEGFHVITAGYSANLPKDTEIRRIIDLGLEHDAFVLGDHVYVDNGSTLTAGHITDEQETELENICKEYSGQMALEWNGYCIPWVRAGLRPALRILSKNVTRYSDVNKKAKELSDKLMADGFNVPLIYDTDLHARKSADLEFIGHACFTTDLAGESASDILECMKTQVFSGKYENQGTTVPFFRHFLLAFGLPVLMSKLSEKFPFLDKFGYHFERPRASYKD